MDRLVIISPLYNEAAHLESVARALSAQTRPPDLWVAVDDGSTDGTGELLERLEREIPFLKVVTAPPAPDLLATRDRLAAAAAPRAFNVGLAAAGDDFDFVGKLDGDIELPADYYERMLDRFAADPSLGIAGGVLVEDHDGVWKRIPIPAYHVHGAVKLYRRPCFDDIGGVRDTLGWDTIDETYARLHGWQTISFADIIGRHHRHWGSADGRLRGRARHGVCAWICGYGPTWIALRSLKLAAAKPRVLSGFAFAFGYARAAVVRTPRVDDPAFRRLVRRELRGRMLRAVTPPSLRRPRTAG